MTTIARKACRLASVFPLWASEVSRFLALHTTPPPRSARATASNADVVVSLTTIPSRMRAIYPTLRSLLDQTMPPSQIYLALPPYSRRERRGYQVPDRIRRQPRVTVLETARDWGPATKLIPVLDHLAGKPDARVVIVDDDNVYPRTFIETLVRHGDALPGAALGLRGWPVPRSLRWAERRTIFGTMVTAPVRTDVLEGCGGILVRPRYFDASLREPTEAALYADDVWISGHLARSRVPAYVVPYRGARIHLGSIAGLLGPALNRTDNREGVHETALMAHFRRNWLSFGESAAAKGGEA